MADSRFAVFNENDVQNLKRKATNQNTNKSTQTWMAVWRSWEEIRGVNPILEEHELETLDAILQRFYAEVILSSIL